MKRDMDLFNALLEQMEATEYLKRFDKPEGYSRRNVAYHLELLNEVGYAVTPISYNGDHPMWTYTRLTWQGQEYLRMIRNEQAVQNAEEQAESKGSKLNELPFEILKALLVEGSKQMFGLK